MGTKVQKEVTLLDKVANAVTIKRELPAVNANTELNALQWLISTIGEYDVFMMSDCYDDGRMANEIESLSYRLAELKNNVVRKFVRDMFTKVEQSVVFDNDNGTPSVSKKQVQTISRFWDEQTECMTIADNERAVKEIKNVLLWYTKNRDAQREKALKAYATANGLDLATCEKLLTLGLIKLSGCDDLGESGAQTDNSKERNENRERANASEK